MDPLKEISKNIKKIRKELKMTQKELADLFNRTEPTNIKTTRADIAKYEKQLVACPATKYIKFMELDKWI